MGFAFGTVSAVSLAYAYLLSSGRIPQCPKFSFLGWFAALWTIQFMAFLVWSVILYPKLFSPLRGLPEPSGNSWFMGQFKAITRNPTGTPQIGWYVSPAGAKLIARARPAFLTAFWAGSTRYRMMASSDIWGPSTRSGS